jgi:hypothetical protein
MTLSSSISLSDSGEVMVVDNAQLPPSFFTNADGGKLSLSQESLIGTQLLLSLVDDSSEVPVDIHASAMKYLTEFVKWERFSCFLPLCYRVCIQRICASTSVVQSSQLMIEIEHAVRQRLPVGAFGETDLTYIINQAHSRFNLIDVVIAELESFKTECKQTVETRGLKLSRMCAKPVACCKGVY